MTSDDIKSAMYLAAIGVAAYIAYQVYQTISAGPSKVASAASAAQQSAASSVADAAQAVLGTGQAVPGGTYTVTMQDGSVQTVPYGQLPQYTAQNSPGTSGLGRLKRRRRLR